MRLYNRLKEMNDALPGLLLGILLYGGIVELIGVWFVSDKVRYSGGLWIGIACAIGMAIHIASVIEDAVRFGGGSKALSVKSALRYVVVVAIFTVMMYFKLGSLIPAFIGVLGLKVSAYAQPLLTKIYRRLFKKDTEENTEDEEVKT